MRARIWWDTWWGTEPTKWIVEAPTMGKAWDQAVDLVWDELDHPAPEDDDLPLRLQRKVEEKRGEAPTVCQS